MEDEDGSTDAFCEVIVLVPWGEDCVFWRQPESSESSQYFHNWASKTLRDHLIFTLMEPVGLQLSSYEREGARGVSSFSTPSTNLRSLHLSWEVPSVQFVQSIQKNHILYQSTRHLQRSLGILFCWNFRFPKKTTKTPQDGASDWSFPGIGLRSQKTHPSKLHGGCRCWATLRPLLHGVPAIHVPRCDFGWFLVPYAYASWWSDSDSMIHWNHEMIDDNNFKFLCWGMRIWCEVFLELKSQAHFERFGFDPVSSSKVAKRLIQQDLAVSSKPIVWPEDVNLWNAIFDFSGKKGMSNWLDPQFSSNKSSGCQNVKKPYQPFPRCPCCFPRFFFPVWGRGSPTNFRIAFPGVSWAWRRWTTLT